MRTLLKFLTLSTLTTVILSACSNINDADADVSKVLSTQVLNVIKKTINGNKDYKEGQRVTIALTRKQANAIPLPSLRLRVNKNNTYATAADIAQNNGVSTYIMAAGHTIQIRNGILIGSRGLGHDLLSLYTENDTIRDGLKMGETYRTYRILDSESNIVLINVRCTFSSGPNQSLTQVERTYQVYPIYETCQGRQDSFKNTYLLDAKTHQMWQSTQWLGPLAESVRIEILTPSKIGKF